MLRKQLIRTEERANSDRSSVDRLPSYISNTSSENYSRLDMIYGKRVSDYSLNNGTSNEDEFSSTNVRFLNDTPKAAPGLNLSDDHLSKLHQTIEEQRKNSGKKLHTEEEQITPKMYDLYENQTNTTKIRKVATASSRPTYKGFNEPVRAGKC